MDVDRRAKSENGDTNPQDSTSDRPHDPCDRPQMVTQWQLVWKNLSSPASLDTMEAENP